MPSSPRDVALPASNWRRWAPLALGLVMMASIMLTAIRTETISDSEEESPAGVAAAASPSGAAATSGAGPPPCCHQVSRAPNASLPSYLFLVGIEGTGHHAFLELFTALRNYQTLKGRINISGWSPRMHLGYSNPEKYIPAPVSYAGWRERVLAAQLLPRTAGTVFVSGADSFPEGLPRKVVNHPDVDHMISADGDLFNLYVLVLLRHPALAIKSTITRGFSMDIDLQARLIEHELAYLERRLRNVPCDRIAYVQYQSLGSTTVKARLAHRMATWLDLDEHLVNATAQQRLRGSSSSPDKLDRNRYGAVVDMFDRFSAQNDWPLLDHCADFCDDPQSFCPPAAVAPA